MESVLNNVVPVAALGMLTFAVLFTCSAFFVLRQQARGFTMMTTGKVLALCGAAAATVTGVEMLQESVVPVSHLIYMLPAAALLYLLGVTILTDFSIHKIPTEAAWLPALIGIPAFILCLASCGGYDWTLDRIFVICVLAVLPVVALLSVLFSGGGAADYRVAMSGFIATAWWVSPASLMFGLVAFFVLTLVGRFSFSKTLPSGKRMTPAGPAYVSLFAVMATVSLVTHI